MHEIAGEGLVLRAPESGDRQRWLELYQDPDEVAYGVPVGAPVPDSLEAVAERQHRAVESIRRGAPATFTIAAAEDPDRFLGNVAWRFEVAPFLRVADVGYSVHPDSRRRGVASRALRVLTRWLTADLDGPGLVRVQLDHSVENTGSCRTALAAGYEREGVRRGFLPLRDPSAPDGVRRHDVCLHGYLPV